MKKILFILLLIPVLSYGQDSARLEVSNVVLKGKDVSLLYFFLEKNNKNEYLDSLIKARYRPTVPNNNADITFNNIERRVWRDLLQILSNNEIATHPANDYYKRIRNAVLLINDSWLNDKIAKIEAPMQAQGQTLQTSGENAASKKEINQ